MNVAAKVSCRSPYGRIGMQCCLCVYRFHWTSVFPGELPEDPGSVKHEEAVTGLPYPAPMVRPLLVPFFGTLYMLSLLELKNCPPKTSVHNFKYCGYVYLVNKYCSMRIFTFSDVHYLFTWEFQTASLGKKQVCWWMTIWKAHRGLWIKHLMTYLLLRGHNNVVSALEWHMSCKTLSK